DAQGDLGYIAAAFAEQTAGFVQAVAAQSAVHGVSEASSKARLQLGLVEPRESSQLGQARRCGHARQQDAARAPSARCQARSASHEPRALVSGTALEVVGLASRWSHAGTWAARSQRLDGHARSCVVIGVPLG